MTPARTPRPAARPESESFREFYADWPRPTQRLRAWKAWQAALKRNPGTDEAGILAASWEWAGYFADEKREPMHIPHPATWLNGNLFLEVPR